MSAQASFEQDPLEHWKSFLANAPMAAWVERDGHPIHVNSAALKLFRLEGKRPQEEFGQLRRSASIAPDGSMQLPSGLLLSCASWPLDQNHVCFQAYPRVALDPALCGLDTSAIVGEQDLRDSLFSSGADCIKLLDLEGRLQFMNAGGQSLMRVGDFRTIQGALWLDFWNGIHREAATQALDAARNGGVGAFNGECAKGDGELGWWDVVITPVRDRSGALTGFLSISREITTLKRAQLLEKLERDILEAAANNQPPAEVLGRVCRLVEFQTADRTRCAILGAQPYTEASYSVVAAPSIPGLDEAQAIPADAIEAEVPGQKRRLEMMPDGLHLLTARKLRDPEGNLLGAVTLWSSDSFDATSINELMAQAEPGTNLATVVLTRETQRRRLRDKQQRLAAVDRTAPIAIYQADTQGHWTYCNNRSLEFTGLKQEDASGEGWLASVWEEDRDRVCGLWREARLAGVDFQAEFRLRRAHPDERPRWVLAQETKVDALGFVGSFIDISDSKEALLSAAQSHERLATLANNISQFCWIANAQGWIYWYNQRWYDYTGTTLEEMQGWGWRKVHHPDHVDRVVEKISECWITGELWEDTFPLRSKTGDYRWFLSRAVPIRDASGAITHWFGTNTDITELRELEGALARQNDALRRSNEELSRFAYVVSHDLQEPVRMMSNYAQLIRRSAADSLDEKTTGYLEAISTAAGRMSRLIRDILSYAVATSEEQTQAVHVDMNEVLSTVRENLRTAIEESSATIEVAGDGLPPVSAVPSKMVQLLQNLVSNSIKYRRLEAAPVIRISAERQGSRWKFALEDNGQGFDNQSADRMFGFLQRLHGRETPGSGIGLSVCRSIVERAGGKIFAKGEPGKGACIGFTLPAAEQ